MPRELRTGTVRVRVPATSANLGPGFDSFGMALAKHDLVELEVGADGEALRIDVVGEGADEVPRDDTHLVVRALRAGLGAWCDRSPRSVRLRCTNAVPHSRGLGSSAAAIVAGLVGARSMLADPGQVSDEDLLGLANRLEGHPDNVAACLSGGFTVAWGEPDRTRSVRLTPDPRIQPIVCVPAWPMSTEQARGLLPPQVPHADAVFTAARAALLVAAIGQRPDLLLEATQDRLHQPYRAAATRPSADLVAALRSAGVPAVVSGAGPSVLALTLRGAAGAPAAGRQIEDVAGPDWVVEALDVDTQGAIVEYVGHDTRLDL